MLQSGRVLALQYIAKQTSKSELKCHQMDVDGPD